MHRRDPLRIGLVEIGTNTTKFFVADVRGDRIHQVYFNRATTRLGRGLDAHGKVGRDAIGRLHEAIRRCHRRTRGLPGIRWFAVGTYALRRARNARVVTRQLESLLGCPIRILSGREEARMAYLSARHALTLRRPATVIADIGGGSTEIVCARARKVHRVRSVPVGALRLTERFVSSDPPSRDDFLRIDRHVRTRLSAALESTGISGLEPGRFDLVGSGGTIATVARMSAMRSGRRAKKSPAPRLTRAEVAEWKDLLSAMTLDRRRRVRGIDPERADILPAGLVILEAVIALSRKRVLYVNDAGVRVGVIVHLLENGLRW